MGSGVVRTCVHACVRAWVGGWVGVAAGSGSEFKIFKVQAVGWKDHASGLMTSGLALCKHMQQHLPPLVQLSTRWARLLCRLPGGLLLCIGESGLSSQPQSFLSVPKR